MCGFTGVLAGQLPPIDALDSMANSLYHRGPDDQGIWSDHDAGIAFGFRRLAIVDLSIAGSQPMRSASGRYVIAFNGEIYNFRELRAALESAHQAPERGWRGHSDTETLVECLAAWGIVETLQRTVGILPSPCGTDRNGVCGSRAIDSVRSPSNTGGRRTRSCSGRN